MAAFRVNMVCHLWDLVDEGIDEVLDRLQGELGVTGLCVPVVCPPMSQLRARPGAEPGVFRTAGGLFFAPQDHHYAATRCRPAVSSWLKRPRDLFGRVVDACRKRQLDCRAVVYASMAGQMAGRYPHAAAKSVFGETWPDRICLVNPDVQAFLVAVCNDLTSNHDISGIELAELHAGRPSHARRGLDQGVDLGPGGWGLLAVCFCESCRQLLGPGTEPDGPDTVTAAARSIEVRLRRVLQSGEPVLSTTGQVVADDAVVRAYLGAQWRAIRGLVESIRLPGERDLIVHTYEDAVDPRPGVCPLAAEEPPLGVALLAEAGSKTGDELDRAARTALEWAGTGVAAEVQIQACGCHGAGPAAAPTLVSSLSRLAELGIASVNLASYGTTPPAALTGIKQAVRFARRTPPGPAESPLVG